ncbi:superoxide dismutase [Cu-Zn] SodC [uncultured Alteromonas sp.]|jgi:Cu-Zn family superoxide dismutase|uniref:superoxide dismutase [Cu-Zn] SodC n=1 Tax=uncultured Alteromonas sp. TaxID=179113 RepID=UPI00258803CD|nr:superoxide dismutase [Cu-Zn] SodC [uncultured Alteromonas sp.]|tara:strand:+ start:501 stop:1046 length:546 start_codon:yes stop_codon:yes gene_type:complete
MKKLTLTAMVGAVSLALSASSFAGHHEDEGKKIMMNNLKTGEAIGSVMVSSYDDDGVVFTPKLSGLTPGIHGFHIHENGDCSTAMKDGKKVLGGAAGGHFDPENTGSHSVPWSEEGHEGDLPTLYVDESGNATQPVFAPELELEDIEGRAIMIHAGGDNYSDSPAKLGGGGERVACGVIGK